jgi:hypothetical protein
MPRSGGSGWDGDRFFVSLNTQPGSRISYFLKKAAKDVTVTISDIKGEHTTEYSGGTEPGLNVVSWTGRLDGRIATPGDYRVTVKVDGKEYLSAIHVEDAAKSE